MLIFNNSYIIHNNLKKMVAKCVELYYKRLTN